ncbi:MAG: hypothetical protein ACO33E_06005 [Aquiluna sp.]
MTNEEFEVVLGIMRDLEQGLIARQEIFAEEIQRLKNDVSALKTKVFALENKGVGE